MEALAQIGFKVSVPVSQDKHSKTAGLSVNDKNNSTTNSVRSLPKDSKAVSNYNVNNGGTICTCVLW